MKRMTKNNVKIFSIIKKLKKLCCVICRKYRKFEKPKISHLSEKILTLSIICCKCKNEDEKMFKEKESIEILKTLGLINNIEEYQKIYNHVYIKNLI